MDVGNLKVYYNYEKKSIYLSSSGLMFKIEGISSLQESSAISVVKIATVNGFYKLLFMNFNILLLAAPSQSNL